MMTESADGAQPIEDPSNAPPDERRGRESGRDSSASRAELNVEDDVDDLLTEIDETLDENPEEFVRGWVKKGGQGWSAFLDPSTFQGFVAAGVVTAGTYATFVVAVKRFLAALRHVPGPTNTEALLDSDGEIERDFEGMLKASWAVASGLMDRPIEHTLEEAMAFQWVTFFGELLRTSGMVKLRPEHYQEIELIGARLPERPGPSQLVGAIVDKWLNDRNGNPDVARQ